MSTSSEHATTTTRPGLLEKLMAVVRAEFRADLYVPDYQDPVLGRGASARSHARTTVSTRRRAQDRLLSVDEVAEFLGVPVATLYQWRHKGCRPAAYRVGKHLRYDPASVRARLEEHLAVDHSVG